METDSQLCIAPYDAAFHDKLDAFNRDWHEQYMSLSRRKTPQYSKSGDQIIKKRWDGLDYVSVGYMVKLLDKHFPGWSWRAVGQTPTQVIVQLGWIVVSGELAIIDPMLLQFGINPPYRYFHGTGAARIMTKKDQPPTAATIVDLDKNVKAANSEAFKVAINRLTFICDDVYGKRNEVEGLSAEDITSGTADMVIPSGAAQKFFTDYVTASKKPYSEVFKALGVNGMGEIRDYADALRKLQKAWG